MIAIEIAGAGGPEVLRAVERPDPAARLWRRADCGRRRWASIDPTCCSAKGHYPPPPGASDIPGLEVAGTVAAVGEGVQRMAGRRSRLCTRQRRRLRHHVCGAGSAVSSRAGSLDFIAAAAIPETFFTVWTNVFDRGRLKTGESALFHGGTSGIGTTAIQLATARGARVFATAGSDEKCRACEAFGAERGINYRTEDFVAVIQEHTEGRGVDVILDIIGGDYFSRNIAALAKDGRLVQIGLMGGTASPTIDLNQVLRRWLTITGSTLRPRSVEEKGSIAAALRREVWPLLESGRVKPIVYRTFPLTDAASAHRLMESSAHIGKIVLTVQAK